MPEPRRRSPILPLNGESRVFTYMNEWDSYAATWLERLFPEAEIDRTDIRHLPTERLERRTRVHFFAGIGGWEYALELAGWPRDRPVWTGSCPCQPFSTAGKMRGFADDRHLWPFMRDCIRDLRPPTVFGEQVGGPGGLEWMSRVRDDLEHLNYAVGIAYLPACSVGAPFSGTRCYWVAQTDIHGSPSLLRSSNMERFVCTENRWQEASNRFINNGDDGFWGRDIREWEDGCERRIEPGIYPLAHGIPNRVDQLRAYGNAIVPQVAALFIRCYMEAVGIA